jgi:uncharacterized pyridoxamine 5'-phosphate oxidase family protein
MSVIDIYNDHAKKNIAILFLKKSFDVKYIIKNPKVNINKNNKNTGYILLTSNIENNSLQLSILTTYSLLHI